MMTRLPILRAGTAAMALASLAYAGDVPAAVGAGDAALPQTRIAGDDPGYVIHISADGLGGLRLGSLLDQGDQVLNPDATDTVPNFRRLFAEGAGTLNARTDAQNTKTLPNHSGMLSGRPVNATPGLPENAHHGWVTNSSPGPGETLHSHGNPELEYVHSVFDVVHDNGLSTALFTSKSKFVLFEETWDDVDGAPDLIGEDNGRDKIDLYYYASTGSPSKADNMQDALLDKLGEEHFRYTFVHYVNADAAGHFSSFASNGYDNAIRRVDTYIGELFDLIENDPVLKGNTTIILSADHGGTGTLHEEFNLPQHYTVPLVVWGAKVSEPKDLYKLNEIRRLDPGGDHVPFVTQISPIRNIEGGNLALDLLGLPAIPGSSANASQDLVVSTTAGSLIYGCGMNPEGSLAIASGAPVFGTEMIFEIDNPLATQADGALPLLFFSLEPAGMFPCGDSVLNASMAGPAESAELLISLAPLHLLESVVLTGTPWSASAPSSISLNIPPSPGLTGTVLYLQGVLWDAEANQGVEVGLTNGIAIQLGT